MRLPSIITGSLFFLVLCSACGPDLRDDEVAAAYAALPDVVDYNFHVKPILSDRCFACHGPDAQNQQAGLRLDIRDSVSVPFDEILARINATDPNIVMPTPESNLKLDPREIAILSKWVEQGAEYKPHWAFVAPEKAPVPSRSTAGPETDNVIDQFVIGELNRRGIAPSPEAERPYLIRRAFFDLNGLPPSLEEIDRWENEPAEDWYTQMIDELLARPAYGERMANYWMDVARFADSEGYLDDFHHAMHPYRDWVISAYNRNLPYDKFMEWQIAGDLLEDPTQEQILATAFNRNHKQNSEGGIIPEEFRVEYVADRANTVGTAFMGLTVGCARCHDHRYDPISQRDYYELFGFFNNTVERGDGITALNGTQNTMMTPAKLAMNAGPTLQLADEETAAIRAHLLDMIEEKERSLRSRVAAAVVPDQTPTPAQIRREIREATKIHLTFDGRGINDEPIRDLLDRGTGRIGKGVVFAGGRSTYHGKEIMFERSDPFTVSFWLQAPKFFEEAHVLYNGNSRVQGYRGWDVMLDSNRVHLRLNHAHPYQSIDVRVDEPLQPGEWRHFVWSYDGSSRAEGVRVYDGGKEITPTIVRDHLVRSTIPYHDEDNPATLYLAYDGFNIGSRHYDQSFTNGRVDEVRILDREAGDLLARMLYLDPLGERLEGVREEEIREFYLLHEQEDMARSREQLADLRRREVETIDTVQEIMVMGDDTHLRPTYILNRGIYDAHGEPVKPGVPEALLAWDENLPRNRLGLARWLADEDHPLTARVAVNQLWYVVFGRGLVESVEDFGNQGSLPTHPELLDWLAVDFRESGWDVKRMIRLMVTSQVYRQSSVVREDLKNIDAANNLLARGHRYRRSAEMVRDNALAASGLLEPTVGGPSVFPYQPPGLWKEASVHPHSPSYEADYEDGLYRRSMYTFWKRNAPAPSMLIFDASTRGECQVRRQRSSTPLQALALMNDPQIIEACRVLAARSIAENRNETGATQDIFRSLTGRLPTEDEQRLLMQFYEDELTYFHRNPLAAENFLSTGQHETDLSAGPARVAALARIANTVMNSTEGYYKN